MTFEKCRPAHTFCRFTFIAESQYYGGLPPEPGGYETSGSLFNTVEAKNMKTNPITDQIVSTLGNMRRMVVTQGVTAEADAMWQHALSLYRMRRSSLPPMPEPSFAARYRPAKPTLWQYGREVDSPAVGSNKKYLEDMT